MGGRASSYPNSIPAVALRSAERFGDRIAIVDGEIYLSFDELKEQMLTVSSSLISTGVQAGDRIALWAPNSAVWITSALGILACGAWLVPINTRFTAREVEPILRAVDASLLLVADGFIGGERLQGIKEANPTLRAIADPVLLPDPGEQSRPEWDGFLRRGSSVPRVVTSDRLAKLGPQDVSDVIFTSGTTGTPKGVMLRHGASLRAYSAFNDSFGVSEGDRVLIGLPFFHCFGYKAGWLVDLLAGATTYPLAVFDGKKVMEMVELHAITHLPGSPTMFWPLLDDPERRKHDLSSVRAAIVGGASIPVTLVRRLQDDLGIDRVLSGYGLTENHAVISFSLPGDSPELVATTVGKVLDGMEVITVDNYDQPLSRGAEGELWVRGYAQMSGYFGDPASTAAAFSDGWLRTGDVGTVDENGYIRITDRKKDIYVTGGFNVAPAEVENVLMTCEQISQAAVVGVPDDRMGEVGAAFVVPVPGLELPPEFVMRYIRERLANYKVPRYVNTVDSLPINPTGKVLKDELRALFSTIPHAGHTL
jgi:acyl-CoA synthetase (AMP-forming)/AMP-acid ligase II